MKVLYYFVLTAGFYYGDSFLLNSFDPASWKNETTTSHVLLFEKENAPNSSQQLVSNLVLNDSNSSDTGTTTWELLIHHPETITGVDDEFLDSSNESLTLSFLCESVSNVSVTENFDGHTSIPTIRWSFPNASTAHRLCIDITSEKDICSSGVTCDIDPSSEDVVSPIPLCPFQKYEVKIYLKCEDKFSDEVLVNYTSEPGVPSAPVSLEAEAINGTSVLIKWEPPVEPNGPVDGYTVLYQSLQGYDEYAILSSSKTEQAFGDLTPWTYYEVSLAAFNNYKGEIRLDGAIAKIAVTTLEEKSSPPVNVTIVSRTNISAMIRWDPPEQPNGNVTSYSIAVREVLSSENKITIFTERNSTEFRIWKLLPFTEYVVNIAAVNGAGVGQRSESLTFITDVGPPGKPQNFEISEKNTTSLTVMWTEPAISNGRIDKYYLSWGEIGVFPSHSIIETNLGKNMSFVIQKLRVWTLFRIEVFAVNVDQYGQMVNGSVAFIVGYTAEDIPGPPRNLTIEEITNSTMCLEWEEPAEPNGVIFQYTIRYNTSYDEPQYINTNTTSNVIQRLLPYTKYTLVVSAWTSAGQGPWSHFLIRFTDIGIPGEPENFAVEVDDPFSILAKWEPPKIKNGPIAGYIILWKAENRPDNRTAKADRTARDFRLPSLQPSMQYKVHLKVFNKNFKGQKLFSKAIQLEATTLKSLPGIPSNITISGFTNTTVSLAWLPPEKIYDPILLYSVQCKCLADGSIVIKNTLNTSLTINDLDPFNEYSFTTSATTNAGQGNWSYPIIQKTDVGVPSTPGHFEVQDITSVSMNVSWSSTELKYPTAGYRIIIFERNNATMKHEITVNFSQCETTIEKLTPWTVYELNLSAYTITKNMELLYSSLNSIHQRTKSGTPDPPMFKEINVLNSSAIKIEWEDVGKFVGPTNYTVYEWKHKNECVLNSEQVLKLHNITRGVYSYLLLSLSPYTRYHFKIMARTDQNRSMLSNSSAVVLTKPDVSGSPSNFEVNCNCSSTSVNLTWQSPDLSNGVISEYQLIYKTEKSQLSNTILKKADDNDYCQKKHYFYQIENLYPEVEYKFSIAAKTEGVSIFGSQNIVTCTLPAGAPPVEVNSSNHVISGGSTHAEITILWKKKLFTNRMGKIRYFSVIVTAYGSKNTLGPKQFCSLNMKVLPNWGDYQNQITHYYQATPNHWNPFDSLRTLYDNLNCHISTEDGEESISCVIGFEKNCTVAMKQYCNGPLIPGKQYGIKLRAYTTNCYTETIPLYVVTAEPPNNSVGLQASLIVVAILLVGGTIIICIVLKKKNRVMSFNLRMVYFYNCSSQRPDSSVEIVADPKNKVELEKPRPLNFGTFIEHVKTMMADSALKFSLQFEDIKQKSPKHSCSDAELDVNKPKNRWINILPFDHSRVKLLPIDDEPGSDYINSCYIPGFSSHREYIASQGPLPTTVDNFWRMIWEQRVEMIVALAQCVERGKIKCEQYWPDDEEPVNYGDLTVEKTSEYIFYGYSLRIFEVTLGARHCVVKQMHFTRWPDFGCPESTEELINFVRAVRDHLSPFYNAPILVHCSAGVGRTGTYVAVDRLMQHIDYHNTIDIYGTVLEMRGSRMNMVQTEDQYIYIHECLRDVLLENLEKSNNIQPELNDCLYVNTNGQLTTEI